MVRYCRVFLLAGAFVLGGCKHEKPNFTYMPNMAVSPAYDAQEPGSLRHPVEGTIPRGYEAYEFEGNPEAAGKFLKNPLRKTRQTLRRGRDRYNIYCIVCHGQFGEGDGTIVPKFPRPPSLQSKKIRDWTDGRIYAVITEGQNLMPSYARQIDPEDRWAIIHYLRVLYRAKHPTESDLEALERY